MAEQHYSPDRSQSRGRDIIFGKSWGNIRRSSASRDPEPDSVEERERSIPRGRGAIRTIPLAEGDESSDVHTETLHSTGRGGLANITSLRSPSVESPPPHDRVGPDTETVSVGRGGAGNMRSRSRSQARQSIESHPPSANHVVSTGRGGSGNIRSPSRSKATTIEEAHPGKGVISDDASEITNASGAPRKHGAEGMLHNLIHHDQKK